MVEKLGYTPAEAAQIIGVSKATLERLISLGYLPVWRCGKIKRVRREDLDNLLKHDIPSVWPDHCTTPPEESKS